ncbi:glycosyltransferase [Putridiphycobacter roseus]|uniref:Glycosyltransferase n=1 Tax=Putridiphycobacter roseus TaxID=2219161 RepID=A0A2W1NH62_9FLAO|nr:glycosyltransferase [Putridiphycobacter roseus]PZE18865.1 glycosyltransferase [Putridiphycobacter roseus]
MKKQKKIIISVTNDLYTDQRVKRICAFLHDTGYDITLCGRKLKSSPALNDRPYRVKRFNLPFTTGALFYASYNVRLFFYLLFHKTDVLLANDLDTLLANRMAKSFKRNTTLVYDAHEYYTGVPELESRPKVQKVWQRIEKYCLPKVDKMYTVNSSIADLYQKLYPGKIEVIRNISNFIKATKSLTKKELGLPLDKKIVIIQGAGINVDRGAEEAVEAIKLVPNTVLIFVGDGDVIPALKEKVRAEKLTEKVLFYGKQPYELLMNFTMQSDLGLSLDKDTNINYKFSLPNKVFDYIHAGIPLLVTDLVEVKKVVDAYQVGEVCRSLVPIDLAKQMENILFNKPLHAKYVFNTHQAAKELNWKNESKKLARIYG